MSFIIEIGDYKGNPVITIWETDSKGERKQYPLISLGKRKCRAIDDLWKEFKPHHYGSNIVNISRTQLHESELVFKAACGCLLMHLRNDVAFLDEADGANVMQSMFDEVMDFIKRRSEEYDRETR